MITTNLEKFIPDAMEVVRLFTADDICFNHNFTEKDGGHYHQIEIGEKTYAYFFAVDGFSDEIEKKRLLKRHFKLAVYKSLCEHFGKTMPWGALTGIRPTKLAYSELENGKDFKKLFTEVFGVSADKTGLIADILDAQKGIYCKEDGIVDLFVGIPFCPSRCKYCSFISAEIGKCGHLIERYTDALVKEIEGTKSAIKKLRSVYIGGGTPVSLPIESLKRILDAIGKVGVEYTVEAGRPDCITEEVLAMLKEYGVTRICVNPQTFNDETLLRLNRRHTVKDIYDKYALAKDKFSVNMDLIAGLENETFDDFKHSVESAIALRPDDITVHTLCIKRGAKLAETTVRLPETEIEKMVDFAHGALRSAGYKPYYLYRQKYMAGNLENTGYALNGKECVYNIDVMEETADNLALGANAVSKIVYNGGQRIERYANPKDILTYLDKIDKIIEEKNRFFLK